MKYRKIPAILLILALLMPLGDVFGAAQKHGWLPVPVDEKILLTDQISPSNQALDQEQVDTDNPRLISESSKGLVFEVRVPWQALELETLTNENNEFIKVNLPGWTKTTMAGAPSLPLMNVQIAVPLGAKLNLNVSPGEFHLQTLSASVMPVETMQVNWGLPGSDKEPGGLPLSEYRLEKDPSIYDQPGPYPGSLVEIANDGIINGQRIVSINAYPVQYNPGTSELTVYETLLVEVEFEGILEPGVASTETFSGINQDLLSGNILNYEAITVDPEDAFEGSLTEEASSPWAPPDPGWRIKIQEDGIYKLTYDELVGVGFPNDSQDDILDLDPRSFQMFNQGNEIALQVVGEADGAFNHDTDFILFYGESIDSKYTADNIYWLTYGKVSQGIRMGVRDASPGTADSPAYHIKNKHHEDNIWYMSSAPGDDDLDRWLGKYMYATSSNPASLSYTIALEDVVPSVNSHIRVSILGNNQIPDHHVKIYVNEVYLGEAIWGGISWQVLDLPIPEGTLVSGNNTIRIDSPISPSGLDYLYIDEIDISFSAAFKAEGGELAFTYSEPGTWNYNVTGFASENISVYDVSSPASPVILSGYAVTPAESPEPGYIVQFHDLVETSSSYQLVEESAYQTVPLNSFEQDNPSNLQDPFIGADHITITHQAFSAQADLLRDHRDSQGLRALAVDVQDIFDEFNHGIIHPSAIRDFLLYTYQNWQSPAPSFVVLLGDGSYDPKDYKNLGQTSFIPPYLSNVDLYMGETAADNRYVTLTGDDNFPDMMIGRLAVRTSAEASAFVNKIINYELIPPTGDWQHQLLAVTDDPDDGGDYIWYSERLLTDLMPSTYQADKVYFLGNYFDEASAQAAILNSISAGKIIVNYIGHGAPTQWGGYGSVLFKASSVPNLTNGARLPIVLPMTCSDGYYINPASNYQSVSEVLTRADSRGAIASWSPTGYGTASGHDYLNRGFFDAYFHQGTDTLGEATQIGKFRLWSTGHDLDLLDTYLLFGDPATRMARPIRAEDDQYQTPKNTSLNIPAPGVLENDTSLEGNPLSAALLSEPLNGSLTLNANGSFAYTPDHNFVGTDSFTYRAGDGSFFSNAAEVTITVGTVANTAPTAVDDNYMMDENGVLNVASPGVLGNDSDPEVDPLTAHWVSGPSNGDLTLNLNGSFTYTPNTGFSGTDSFSYKANDGELDSNSATVTITVNGGNEAPVLGAIGDKTIAELSTLSFTATATDPDLPANALTFSLENAPSGATIDPVSGAFSWTPTEAQGPGQVTFTVKVCDDGTPSLCDTEEITVTVTEVNQAPVLEAIGDKTVDEQSTLSFIATTSDPDLPANTLTFSLENAPSGASIDPASGAFAWSPTEAQGPALVTFTVKVCDDGAPALCDTEEITVTVTEVNQAPVLDAVGDKTVDEQSTLSFTATASDPDLPANALTFSLEDAPSGASIDPASGAFAWTPTEAQGPGQYTFTVKVCDDSTPSLCDTEEVTVTVTEVNQAPVLGAIGDKTIAELSTLSFTATAADPDLPANALTFSLEDAPSGASIDPASGAFSWTPTEAQGPGSYTFDVKVCDDGAPVLCDTEEITVTVTEVNQAPVFSAIGDKTIDEQSTLSFTATATDLDLPANTLTFSLEGAPSGASIDPASGDFSWTPTEEQGPDSYTFTVKVCDNGTPVLCDSEEITVTVNEDSSQVSIPLYEGWNLVSFNLVPPSTAVADVLAAIEGNYTLVYAWDPNDETNGPWLLYDPSALYASDLTDIDRSMGFWIKMAVDDTLVISGTQPETTSIALSEGWNLVGYPAAQSQILPDALETNGIADYNLVMAYHAPDSEPWLLFDPAAPSYVNDLTEMAPSWGYWVEVNSDGTWELTYELP